MDMIIAKPIWETDIKPLFAQPYWLPADEREAIGAGWIAFMIGYGLNLSDPASLRESSVTVFDHLASRNMPRTPDERQFWPLEALETFRLWVNQGWRIHPDDPFDIKERIPVPELPGRVKRVRCDIRSLTPVQIDLFRSKFDDILQVGDPSPASPWQQFAYVHTNWCLHYQEAFPLWHRASLLYLEELIDHPIPYWDWMARDASVDGSPQAGLPQAFLEHTYIHPVTGERRPNPLRYAAAKDGRSKACASGSTDAGIDCRYVQRNPLFDTTGDTCRKERQAWYAMARLFQQQVIDALAFDTFSAPQGAPGLPWANLPAFTPPQPDAPYIYRNFTFDGLFEQPHDNYHGWIGADMADNAYTAFDPVFLAYHANIDRVLEMWIRAHPGAQYTTQTPLHPFIGRDARKIRPTSPDRWRFTTLGDMAQDSRHLDYDYGPPVAPQYDGKTARFGANEADKAAPAASTASGTATAAPANAPCCDAQAPQAGAVLAHTSPSDPVPSGPWVMFEGVRCTHDSYVIDVFINQPEASQADARLDNRHYVGRFSRIGMGLADDKGRCIRHGVARVLNAGPIFAALELAPDAPVTLTTCVTHLDSGRRIDAQAQRDLPGFQPVLVRSNAYGAARFASPPLAVSPAVQAPSGGCCSRGA